MGRGRQKAKQTKVARELKYHSSSIDVTALERELAGGTVIPPPAHVTEDNDKDDEYGDYSAYLDEDDEEDEGYTSVSSRR